MAEGKFATCSRYFLIIFNFLFWICGGVLVGVGIWAVVDPNIDNYIDRFASLKTPADSLYVVAYVFIGVGAFMFFVGFFGCCGAIRESACLLGLYIGCMCVVVIAEIAGVIYLAVEKGNLENLLHRQLGSEVANYTRNSNSTDTTIDFLQVKFHCCGTDNYTDYLLGSGAVMNESIPKSCCVSKNRDNLPSKPVNYTVCQMEAVLPYTSNATMLYTQGCYGKLIDWLDGNSTILIGVGVGILVIEILGIIFAVCLCRNRTEYYYDL